MGRALAASTFHHFADYNRDLDRGAPSFVTEPPGTQIKADPSRLAIYKDNVRNIATWLAERDWPRYDEFRVKSGDREIPVMVLEPF